MTMVEKLARAIYTGRNGAGCKAWGHLPASHRAPYIVDALAVLEALKEPTEAMLVALEANGGEWRSDTSVRSRAAYAAMIQSIIDEHREAKGE